jgi:hypothetical protein
VSQGLPEPFRKLVTSPTTHARHIPEHTAPAALYFLEHTQQATQFKMPPKGKKGQDKGKSGEEERDEPLQAVVRLMMRLRRALC